MLHYLGSAGVQLRKAPQCDLDHIARGIRALAEAMNASYATVEVDEFDPAELEAAESVEISAPRVAASAATFT